VSSDLRSPDIEAWTVQPVPPVESTRTVVSAGDPGTNEPRRVRVWEVSRLYRRLEVPSGTITSDVSARARPALFRIPIEPVSPDDSRHWWWGTGFFISAAGHALTAFHNLPAAVERARSGRVKAVDASRAEVSLDFVPTRGDKGRDVALLRACPEHRPVSHYLPIAALEDGLSDQERARWWAARAVLVCGFPVNAHGHHEEAISAHVRGDAPFGIEDIAIEGRIVAQVETLRIVPDRSMVLPGISGAPVIDLGTGLVMAVQAAWDTDRGLILASELRTTTPAWPDEVRKEIVVIGDRSARRRRFLWALLAALAALAVGWTLWPARPGIEIEEPLPPYDPVGGRMTSASIQGRVWGVDPRAVRVVIYSLTSEWYVQPTVQKPITEIAPDGRWRADGIHTGAQYAALLVKPGFQPTPKLSQLPVQHPDVLAWVVRDGQRQHRSSGIFPQSPVGSNTTK
jgi:hypothetical protein